jgi:hypothetical protein
MSHPEFSQRALAPLTRLLTGRLAVARLAISSRCEASGQKPFCERLKTFDTVGELLFYALSS